MNFESISAKSVSLADDCDVLQRYFFCHRSGDSRDWDKSRRAQTSLGVFLSSLTILGTYQPNKQENYEIMPKISHLLFRSIFRKQCTWTGALKTTFLSTTSQFSPSTLKRAQKEMRFNVIAVQCRDIGGIYI